MRKCSTLSHELFIIVTQEVSEDIADSLAKSNIELAKLKCKTSDKIKIEKI